MGVAILVLVVIGVLFTIASGVWVAIALVRAISADRTEPDSPCRPNRQINHREHTEKIE